MPIPRTREELIEQLETSYAKLDATLDEAGEGVAEAICVDTWTVRDLLAVRCWWTESVADWIEAGRRGEVPATPAAGYRWKDTPRLNAEIVAEAAGTPFPELRARLRSGYSRVVEVVAELDDRQLCDPGVFEWAGNYPIARWISLNTVRHYTTARTFVRRIAGRR